MSAAGCLRDTPVLYGQVAASCVRFEHCSCCERQEQFDRSSSQLPHAELHWSDVPEHHDNQPHARSGSTVDPSDGFLPIGLRRRITVTSSICQQTTPGCTTLPVECIICVKQAHQQMR